MGFNYQSPIHYILHIRQQPQVCQTNTAGLAENLFYHYCHCHNHDKMRQQVGCRAPKDKGRFVLDHAASQGDTVAAATDAIKTLSKLVKSDMDAVNACLLERMQSDVPLIPELAGYLIAAGGKRIRPLLTLASARLCGYEGANHVQFAASVEFIHTATLLHDDVVDESELRRGRQTANRVWNNQASVLVGDFLYSRSFQLMVEQGNMECLRILADASAIIAGGEVLQLSIQNDLSTSEDAYMDVIRAKTAALFAAACEVGGAVGAIDQRHQAALRSYGENLGIAFQLVDDALDYKADETALGKTIGDDFAEGKITLPVLLAYAAGDAAECAFWKRAIEDKEQSGGDLQQAQRLIERHKAIEQTVLRAQHFGKRAKGALAGFPESTLRQAMLDVVDFTIARGH